MADNRLTLDIGASNGGVAPLRLTIPGKAPVDGTLDTAELLAALAPDGIHKDLNDRDNRAHAETIGKALFNRLFPAGTPMRDAWDGLTISQRNLPLELSVADADLRGYPWEMVWDPKGRRHARLGGLIRRTTAKASPPTDASNWPFRVAIVTGTEDANLPVEERIGTDKEVDELRRALVDYGRSVDLRRIMPAKAEDLSTMLAEYQPHVLHFIGHGTYHLADKSYALLVQRPGGATLTWNVNAIRDAFTKAECIPRLVFLNCCRSGDGLDVATRATINIQDTLTGDLGIPAVIAMQADVPEDLATKFSKGFYAHALAGPEGPALELPSLIAAVQNGRAALGNDADIDWALASLALCSDVPADAGLFTRQKWSSDPSFLLCREFNDARVYADDCEPRRQMIQWLFPVRAAKGRQPNVLIVRGAPGSGKSRLLHWCMESWAMSAQLRQLTVQGLRGRNCLGWLIQLRAGSANSKSPDTERLLREPLAPEAFDEFYRVVAAAANLLDAPGKADDPAKRMAEIDEFRASVTDDKVAAPIYERFITGLAAVGPIVLILDQVSAASIASELFKTFRDSFLKPIGERTTGDVRVVLSVSTADYDTLELGGLASEAAKVVDVTVNYTDEALETLAVEALRYRYEELIRDAAQKMLKLPDEYVGLARLSFCQDFLRRPAFRDLKRMK